MTKYFITAYEGVNSWTWLLELEKEDYEETWAPNPFNIVFDEGKYKQKSVSAHQEHGRHLVDLVDSFYFFIIWNMFD